MFLSKLRDILFPKSDFVGNQRLKVRKYSTFEYYRESLVRELLHDASTNKKGLLIDIGASIGKFSHISKSFGFQTVAVEIDEKLARQVKKEVNCETVIASVTMLPFIEQCAKIILALELLEHLPNNDRRKSMHEFSRVLRPSGLLLTSTPNLTSVLGCLLTVIGIIVGEPRYSILDKTHQTFFTATEFLLIHRLSNFQISEVFGFYYLPLPHIFPGKVNLILNKLRFLVIRNNVLSRFGGIIWVLAEGKCT